MVWRGGSVDCRHARGLSWGFYCHMVLWVLLVSLSLPPLSHPHFTPHILVNFILLWAWVLIWVSLSWNYFMRYKIYNLVNHTSHGFIIPVPHAATVSIVFLKIIFSPFPTPLLLPSFLYFLSFLLLESSSVD